MSILVDGQKSCKENELGCINQPKRLWKISGQKIDQLYIPNRPLEDLETERINYAFGKPLDPWDCHIHLQVIFSNGKLR